MRVIALILMLFGALSGGFALIGWLPFIEDDLRLDAVGVAVFAGGGLLIFLIGEGLDRIIPEPKPKAHVLKAGDTRFIAAMLRSAARSQFVLGVVLVLTDILWISQLPSAEEIRVNPGHPLIVILISAVFMLLFAGIAVLCFFASFTSRDTDANVLRKLLIKSPEKISSLAITRISHVLAPDGIGRRNLAVILAGNVEFRITVSDEHRALLVQYLQLRNPNVSITETHMEV